MSLGHFARGAVSAENARRQIELRGFTPNGHRLWTMFEAGTLRVGYPDYNAVMAINTRRTRPAHHGKASRMKITRPRAPEWDVNEITRLHRMFPRAAKADLLAALPGRSWRAISGRAWKDGYRRPKGALVPTGDTLLDQIRERARQKGWTLEDLDFHTASGGYFAKSKWRGGASNAAIFVRAVRVLGGQVRARRGV